MTETQHPMDMQAAWALIQAQHAARERLGAEALRANKAVLFDALAAVPITRVVVTFDGYGDSGQIESIDAHSGDETAELPTCDIEIISPSWDGSELKRQTLPVRSAVEALAYDFLEQTHGGWENNDGAFGEFTFDVAARSITLDYNERSTATEPYAHEF